LIVNFGDGGTSSAQNPVHDYVSTTGNYTVCLTITSGNCSDTYCQPITLGDCQADFTYTNTDPSTFNFIDLSWSLGGNIIAWNWTFGDGTTSTEQNPQHVYTGVGSYDVCLTFTTAIGCTSTVCQTVTVSLTPICNADFNYQTLANGDLQFNDLSTANSTIVSWAWTFGNQTSSAQNPIQTFVGGFSYDVCLTITTLAGCTDFSCQVVFVPPTCAAFFSNQPTATNPTTIVFTDGSTSNNQITGWLWNFGDNSESEQANPIHTYQQAGTYNVCLTITTANGCNDTYCREIIVGDPCALLSADFTVTGPILFFNPFLKIFTNTSVGDIDNFVWTFGDGTSDNTNLNPTHTYTAFDTYEACLTISNNAGCTVTHCETVVVAPSAPPTINSVTIVPNLLLADGEQIVKVIVESTQAQKCTLTSFAINGQYLKQYEVDLITGENEINLDFTYLSPAVYVVRVEIGNGLPFHEKVFKLK
jgi:PKD repeat protein